MSSHDSRVNEKTSVEDVSKASLTDDDTELLSPERRAAAEQQLVRKLDMRLMPAIVLIFILNYIDRTAVAAARLKGLEKNLRITDTEYDTIIAILYATYIPAQLLSNSILNWISRPSWFIPLCVIAWGVVSATTGVSQNFAGILITRLFLGIPEAVFYPGAFYLLSCWYTRRELTLRSAILYAGLLISNAFGNLIAAGILSGMEGVRGIRAWRWLFYIEGAITILVGILAIFLLPDYPHNTRWLTAAQRRLARVRLAEDAGQADQDTSHDGFWTGIKQAFLDVKTWIFVLLVTAQLLGLSFVNFFPTLTATLGYSATKTLLLATPPWLLATILCAINGWHADRTGERFFHLAGWWWAVIVGYIIALSTMNTGGRYVALFLLASGYSGVALTLAWVANAIPRPPAKRSAAIGIVSGVGNLGSLAGSYAWKAKWGPRYHQSMYIGISALVVANICALTLRFMLAAENKKLEQLELQQLTAADRERIEEAAKLKGITFQEALNKRKGFRYLY